MVYYCLYGIILCFMYLCIIYDIWYKITFAILYIFKISDKYTDTDIILILTYLHANINTNIV